MTTPSASSGDPAIAAVDVARALYTSFGRGDIAAVLALFDPAIEWRSAENNPYRPEGTPWIGPQEILTGLFERIPQDWDGFTVTPLVIRAMDGGAAVQLRYTGVFKTTGRALDLQACHLLQIRDGRLTHFQQYLDTASLRSVMGITA